jgi:acetyl-CoA carboxylase carboxyl transferase subunit alpha
MFIGQQKGVNTKMRQFRNFGMPNPEGYRKALRLMKLAEKFNKPVVTLIDTPGAFPGLEAEERGQGEAIARNLLEMSPIESAHYLCGGGGGSIRRSIRHWCRRPGTDDGE